MCPNNTTNNHNTNTRAAHASRTVETPPRSTSHDDRDVLCATDDPPPVLSRNAACVRVRNQTPQHVATLVAPTSSCSLAEPLILCHKYFLWGLEDGKIGLWTNEQMSGGSSSTSQPTVRNLDPAALLETNASTLWTHISLFSADKENFEIVCLTSAGVFYHVKVHETPELKLEVIKTWHTKRAGAECFCVTKSHCIVVGYNNGYLEAWKKEKRLWFGNFKEYPGIRSVIPIETSTRKYVLVTLEHKDIMSTASSIEILCLTALENNADHDRTRAVPLEEYWVPLPEAGRDVEDATTISEAYQQRTSRRFDHHWIPSHGSHVATLLSHEGLMMVEVADGSVLFLDAAIDDANELCWGVAPGRNEGQFLLNYPTIGRGVVKIGTKSFAACALRGGTVYLFPFPEHEMGTRKDEEKEIRCCYYPDDVSKDSSMQQVQAFVAGNVQLSRGLQVPQSFPLLFFCWPGGICDVYAAHLLPSCGDDANNLTTLVESGTAEDLCRLLKSLPSDSDSIFAEPLWVEARKEVMARKTNDLPISAVDLRTDKFAHFLQLLEQMSDPSIDI